MLPKYTQRARRRHDEQLRDLAGQHFVVEPCSNCGLEAFFLVLLVDASVVEALLILVVLTGMLVSAIPIAE
jgi:hypothetical protein